ncbi:MAG: lysine--tRNA ligase [Nanoarchaeota archaeon]|nr:lysine--tRNA ligase [Nanoarchaeota archaeon]MBU1030325.1 lysine--tRNA ligase [Nanoarchaeota archaeon]MBU1849096.1 lysine--tRNA ligase [Nanoarchaeota archaeon]
MLPEDQLIKERIRKLNEIKEQGIEPYEYRFDQKNHAKELQEKYKHLKKEDKTRNKAVVAGRIIILRRMGKATFADLQDATGKIQLYFKQDDLGKPKYNFLKKLDVGDIIGVEGTIFKTRMGEVTVYVKDYKLLTKSLRPLPEKYHGLKDVEARYRQRYVDLIVNPEVKDTFVIRSKIFASMREFLEKEGFLEVETPILQAVYGGASAKPFVTKHNALDMNLYLRISNELYLKRLIVGGFEKVFEFCRDFRNEGIDTKHNPEFTLMETMSAYDNYEDSMDRTERMLEFMAKKVAGTTKIKYQGTTINLKAPFKKITMVQAVKKETGYDFSKIKNIEEARKIARELKIQVTSEMGIGAILAEICGEKCEPKFVQPTILYEYPREISSLAKIKKSKPEYTERFELIIAGMEFGNMYSELNDPQILRENWKLSEEKLEKGDEEAEKKDDDFIRSLEYGMPPTSGIGIGMDRLVMLFTDSASIRDVILFPTMRPEK